MRVSLLFILLYISLSTFSQNIDFLEASSLQKKLVETSNAARVKPYQVYSINLNKAFMQSKNKRLVLQIPGMPPMTYESKEIGMQNSDSVRIRVGRMSKEVSMKSNLVHFNGYSLDGKHQCRLSIGIHSFIGYFENELGKYYVESISSPSKSSENAVFIYKETESVNKHGMCGNENNSHQQERGIQTLSSSQQTNAGVQRIMDIAVAVDYSTFSKYNKDVELTTAVISSIYNMAQAYFIGYFSDDLNFRISELYIATSPQLNPWPASEFTDINLSSFTIWAPTGFQKPFDISSYWFSLSSASEIFVGRAFLGSTCDNRGNHVIRDDFSTVQYLSVIVAHEIGHNFNAQHDQGTSPFIMSTGNWMPGYAWSEGSKNTINEWLKGADVNCMTPAGVTISGPKIKYCAGIPYTVNVVNPVNLPKSRYMWRINQIPIGVSGTVFSSPSLKNGDLITCDLVMDTTSSSPEVLISNSLSASIIEMPAPKLKALDATTFCQGNKTRLQSNNTFYINQWYRNDTLINESTNSLLDVIQPGAYSLKIKSEEGCISASSNTVPVSVHLIPEKPKIEVYQNILTSSISDGNQWYLNDSMIVDATSRRHYAKLDGKYTVQVTAGPCKSQISDPTSFKAPVPDSIYVYPFAINQLPELVIDAGKDTSVVKGTSIRIGGIITAKGGSGIYTYTWSPVVGLDKADIANPIAKIDSTITYTLTVSDVKGCLKTAQVTIRVNTVTAIDPIAAAIGLQVFPNPSRGLLFVKTDLPITQKYVHLEIFDAQGRQVYFYTITGARSIRQTIDLGQQAKGIYILKVYNNEMTASFKIILQ